MNRSWIQTALKLWRKKLQILLEKTSFELPDFAKKAPVTGAQIGSAIHELMQRIPLDQAPTIVIFEKSFKTGSGRRKC